MKKLILVSFIALAVTLTPGFSSAQAFQNGDNILGLGVGFGSSIGSFGSGTESPGISLQYEHGNWAVGGPGVISLGGYLGYKSYSYDYTDFNGYAFSQSLSYTIIGIRSAYHYNGITDKNWDVYGGIMLSYLIASFSHSTSDPYYNTYNYNVSYGSELYFSLYIGARYFVSQRVALFAELGYGVSYFNIGAAVRL